MMLTIGLALAAAAPQPGSAAPARQATATVTIVRAEGFRFAEIDASTPERFRDTQVRERDGSLRPARLIEFE